MREGLKETSKLEVTCSNHNTIRIYPAEGLSLRNISAPKDAKNPHISALEPDSIHFSYKEKNYVLHLNPRNKK